MNELVYSGIGAQNSDQEIKYVCRSSQADVAGRSRPRGRCGG
jgi:hypothetical protein